jgi:NitT/TauT family transport system permease protein
MALPLLRVREPLSPTARTAATALAFLTPLALWALVSYVPFIWHPQVLVEDAGDSTLSGTYDFIAANERVDLQSFELRNQELARAGKKLATGERVNPIYLPAPHEVARAFYTAFTTAPERRGDFWLHESLWHSCKIIFWGFLYAALLALPLGVLCGTFPLISQLSEPFIDFVRYMPAPVFGALAVAIFGLADAPKITIIFIGTFFQMVLVVANTTRQVEPALLHAAQTLGASTRQLLTRVVIPSALPNLYRDTRILIGWAWTYLVVAELIGEKSGISAFIYQQQRYRHFDNVYASIVIIGAVGLLCDQLFGFAGAFLFPWQSAPSALARWLRALPTRLRAAVSSSPEPTKIEVSK